MAIDRAKLEEAIDWMTGLEFGHPKTSMHHPLVIEAARAHLATLPKTKMIEVWRVEVAYKGRGGYIPKCEARESKAEADKAAQFWRNAGHACIRVTGPHQQEIPDDAIGGCPLGGDL